MTMFKWPVQLVVQNVFTVQFSACFGFLGFLCVRTFVLVG